MFVTFFVFDKQFAKCRRFLVFGDPHVAIPIPGSDYPLCYDITGYDGDVIELLSVKDSGTILYLFYFPKKRNCPFNIKLLDGCYSPARYQNII